MEPETIWVPCAVDEGDLQSIRDLPADCNYVKIGNPAAAPVDARALRDRIAALPSIEGVRRVQIEWNSQLIDVSVISAFPKLEALFVYGLRIQTLRGVESFHGKFLKVDTGKNKKRNIDLLTEAHVDGRLILTYAKPADIVALGACRHLQSVTLGMAPAIDFRVWKGSNVSWLDLNSCPMKVFEDSASAESLRKLSIVACRKLERFAGDCSNIETATIEPPKTLDWSTLAALSGLKGLSLMGKVTVPFRLSSLPPMPKLESMALWVDRVEEQDVPHLTSVMPRLHSLKLPPGASSIARACSGKNPELLVSAGDVNLRAGQPVTAGSGKGREPKPRS